MNVTKEQLEAAGQGQAVEFEDGGRAFVLISREMYDRMKNLIYDDSEWTEDEMMHLASEAAEDLDHMKEIQP